MPRHSRRPFPISGAGEDSEPSPRQLVLLGAGASKLADVPLTREFVTSLADALAEADRERPPDACLRPLYDRLLAYLKRLRPKASIDIELVYESLVRLAEQDDDVLLVGHDHLPLTKETAQRLKGAAEQHIRARAFVDLAKTTYLDELIALRANEPLTIFSTNYDTAIEVLAERHRLRWEDGFRVRWDPAVFRDPGIDIRLHKLHGSVLWYRDQFGSYLRSPLRPHASDPGNLEWFGGRCEPLLIYPARKAAQDAPYTYGLLRLSSMLGGRPRPVQLVVIGYSFRDRHLRQVIADAAVANPHLSVVLVDPNASAIYESELLGTPEMPSPLADRVFCVNEGLDARGAVLRGLSQRRLTGSADAFAKERALTLASAGANSFEDLACSYARVGDLHGLDRSIARLWARGEPIPPKTAVRNAAFAVVVAARSGVGPTALNPLRSRRGAKSASAMGSRVSAG